ncbi:glutamate 5-kinase [Bifidobacterium scardovii]|uniref:Glutamate 5-kinase n=1 Tax=Bifidobacterium scardovii TaxID=158787 RepID=A0A087D470_9BIFI|nr:glutamate 5-kinase [Bifidobacterium scardovii]KFI90320.1 glutamate 5-kinase [Bifidobacterium scardovii]MDK6349995.1 glutamate 5-kinase [Bifidobacterium scardovii]MDU2421509.1 glutamate 5-kinase [Bifidobacterium scardovii]MDU8982116.1 glutamate 5-kinase [Bifidobacterium scardovii]BAQ30447.1 gamma-glutamyl kinase [Bifidobacterium scardovii JCM 12489 = DSM 13734]
MPVSEAEVRLAVAAARTVVVKVGSSSLTQPSGHLDVGKLSALAAALSAAVGQGARVVLVSSGAIAAGFGPLGFDSRPTDVATQQATAAVGQGLLMAQYEMAFGRFGVRVGQILITAEDTIRAVQYRNVQRTLGRLLELGVVPIVNENDSLASNEIRFGDNDRLSALVANIVRADALVLLTDVDALYTAPPSQPGSRRIGYVPDVIAALDDVTVGGSASGVGTGGMVTKLEAARVAAVSGIPTVLTCASNAGPALMGDPVGTAFAPVKHRGSSRRLWIGFAANPRGTLVADEGASRAVRGGRASLLSAGVLEVRGEFSAGDPVWIDDESGEHLARGLAGFDSEEIPQMLGRTTVQLKRFLGDEYAHPLVHRDNLVLV